MKNNFIRIFIFLIIISLGFASLAGCEKKTSAAPAVSEAVSANSVGDAISKYYAEMPEHIYKISEKEFVDKVKTGESMLVLDLRRAEDYAKGHVKGAVNVPFGMSVSDNLEYLPQEGEVYIYCYSGQTAGQAVMLMNAAGIPARSVNLGWNFGISKVDGAADVTDTKSEELDKTKSNTIDSAIAKSVKEYFEHLPGVKDTPFANNIVSEENAKAILDSKDDSVVLLSIRSAEDYAKGHIEGAVNIPFGNNMYPDLEALPVDKKILVYCYSGQTAGQTVAAMRLAGFDAVSLKGGMGVGKNAPMGWSNQNYPVVK
jgi:rhodanese-related sulfurtransferase